MCIQFIFYKFQRAKENPTDMCIIFPNFVACCSVFDCLFVLCVIQFIQRACVQFVQRKKIMKKRKKCKKKYKNQWTDHIVWCLQVIYFYLFKWFYITFFQKQIKNFKAQNADTKPWICLLDVSLLCLRPRFGVCVCVWILLPYIHSLCIALHLFAWCMENCFIFFPFASPCLRVPLNT